MHWNLMRSWCAASLGLSLVIVAQPAAQSESRAARLAPQTADTVRRWDARLDAMSRGRQLVVRRTDNDALAPGRTHERLDQYVNGVRVFGADVSRQLDRGVTVSLFGVLYPDADVETTPSLDPAAARAAIEHASGARLRSPRDPELVVLPAAKGGFVLAYTGEVWAESGPVVYFVDAHSGAELWSYSNLRAQSAVREGVGVLNDQKKVSMTVGGGGYVAVDALRPPAIVTYDMRANLTRTINILNGDIPVAAADVASTTQSVWSDGMSVDAQAYLGWTYDFYFKRFSRRGLDNNNVPLQAYVHTVNRADVLGYSAPIQGTFFLNAFYAGDGIMVFGEGLLPTFTAGGQRWNYTSGALDVIAHELTHGVTDYTSRLIYRGESGALNEAFSDIMGTSAEFYYASIRGRAGNYLLGEDVVTPGGLRSMADPQAYGDPDHYARRYTGTSDNGGVHINSGIANNAFYLAIEGGRNRTSGIAVTGVGAANRQQIENVFYRAFTLLMPSGATFAIARQATIRAAQDLYGASSAAAVAIAQAWTAVG